MWQLHFSKQYIKARRHYFTAIRKKIHLLSYQKEIFTAWQKSRCRYVKMTTSQYPFNNLGQGASVCEGFKNPSQGSSTQVQDIFISHSAHNSSNTVCLLLWLLSGGHTLYMCRCVDEALHTHTIPGPNCHYPTSQIKSNLPVSVRCLFVLPFPSRLSFSLTQL